MSVIEKDVIMTRSVIRNVFSAAVALFVAFAPAAFSVQSASAAVKAAPVVSYKPSPLALKGYTKTFTVPAPAAECAVLKLPKGCKNKVTVHQDPAKLVQTPSSKLHAAAARPAAIYNTGGTAQICSAISCGVWHAREHASFNFTGGWVRDAGNNCGDYGGFGVSFTVTWCGSWNSGTTSQSAGGGQMYDGENILVSALVKGFPESVNYQMRIWCNVDGVITFK